MGLFDDKTSILEEAFREHEPLTKKWARLKKEKDTKMMKEKQQELEEEQERIRYRLEELEKRGDDLYTEDGCPPT